MLITPANLSIVFTGIETLFWAAYQAKEPWWPVIATMIPSSTEQNFYPWMGKIPTMQEWIGPRKTQNAATRGYNLINKPYELTLAVDKFKIEDDTYGVYNPITTEMGWQAKKWPDYQLRDLIRGTGSHANDVGLDGLAFFHASHPVDIYDPAKGTYANTFGSKPLTIQNYSAGRAAMMAYKGEDGESLEVVPNLLVVPPQLEEQAKHVLESEYTGQPTIGTSTETQVGATNNVWRGSAKHIVLPELSPDPTTWYLLDTSRAIKPFIFQQRTAVNFVTRIAPDDPRVFDLHEYVYGTDARGNVGYGHSWLAARFTA